MQRNWGQVNEISFRSGIYAWYYRPNLSTHDINVAIRNIEESKKRLDLQSAHALVQNLLETSVFFPFQETPYEVRLKGRLKANYYGKVDHSPSISNSLVERLVEEPNRLWQIKEILFDAAPNFASPLYIGMAKSLRSRLNSHKKLIESYRQNPEADFIGEISEVENDHSFAKEVVVRRLHPSQLFVCVEEIEDDYVDLENILNRINFPLFGRN